MFLLNPSLSLVQLFRNNDIRCRAVSYFRGAVSGTFHF